MKKIMLMILVFTFLFSTTMVYANHNSTQKENNKCEKSQKYLEKSKNAKNESYSDKYYKKYIKYNKYCDNSIDKKCDKALKYLAKSESTKKPKYAKKYYDKYLKYSQYCKPVVPPNNPPVAYDIHMGSFYVGNAVIFTLLDLPASDAEDTDSKLLQREIVGVPTGGFIEYKQNGIIYYWLPATIGTYSFTFKVKDSNSAESNIATVKVEVIDSNDF